MEPAHPMPDAVTTISTNSSVVVAVNDTMGAVKNQPVSLPAAKLPANDRDAKGHPLTVVVVSITSINGRTVALVAGIVTYTPPAGGALFQLERLTDHSRQQRVGPGLQL
jgi:hypothetical protein